MKHPSVSTGYLLHKNTISNSCTLSNYGLKVEMIMCTCWFIINNSTVNIFLHQFAFTTESKIHAAVILKKVLLVRRHSCKIFSFFLITEACHVRPHLAPTKDSGERRASCAPDVQFCWVSDLQSSQQERGVRLQDKIWPL